MDQHSKLVALVIRFFSLNFCFCSAPCDIVGDISYEELRLAAYDDARRGLSLQSIVRSDSLFLFSINFY